MDDVDLGDAQPPRDEATDSSGSFSPSHSDDDDGYRDEHGEHDDHDERTAPLSSASAEGLSQRLRGSLQRRVTPLVGTLRHSIATSTGVDATTNRLRSAMQRMRGGRDDHATNNQAHDDTDDDHRDSPQHTSASTSSAAAALRASLATAGLALLHEDKLVLLGYAPLVQPQDDVLFLERPTNDLTVAPWVMRRGEFVRIRCPDDQTQSWLCQLATDKASADADVLELAAPFPGSLLPDAVVHYVPHECLPTELKASPDAAAVVSDTEDDGVADLRSSVDAWRPSVDDADASTDDEASISSGYASVTSRTSVARDKAAAFYETLKTRKSRLRTSSADYKDKLKASKDMLAAAGQVSKEKLVVASQLSKEKLAVASQASKEKLASVVSKEKLAGASQASKEKLAVAGQASKLKMQSWTSSAKSSFKAKMAQRAEQKAAAASAAATSSATMVVATAIDGQTVPDVFTIEGDDDNEDEDNQSAHVVRFSPARGVADVGTEEEQLRRELVDC